MTEAELVNRCAKEIYDLFIYTDRVPAIKPDWWDYGNSDKQDEARRYARAIIPIVQAAERERCARIAENMPRVITGEAPPNDRPPYAWEAARAIRAGEKAATEGVS